MKLKECTTYKDKNYGSFVMVIVPFIKVGNIARSNKWEKGQNRNGKYYLPYIGKLLSVGDSKSQICDTYLFKDELRENVGLNRFLFEDTMYYSIAGVKVDIPFKSIQCVTYESGISFLLIQMDVIDSTHSDDLYKLTNYFKYGQYRNNNISFGDVIRNIFSEQNGSLADFSFTLSKVTDSIEYITYIGSKVESIDRNESYTITKSYNGLKSEFEDCFYSMDRNVLFCYTYSGLSCFYIDNDEYSAYYNYSFNHYLQTNYLSMYLFVLQQKFQLIYYLDRFIVDANRKDYVAINKIRNGIYDFKQKYAYNVLSTENTMNELYSSLREMYKLNLMFDDLQNIVNRVENERSNRLSRRIGVFTSFFSVFSVLSIIKDIVDLRDYFGLSLADVSNIFPILLILIIVMILVWGFDYLRHFYFMFIERDNKR